MPCQSHNSSNALPLRCTKFLMRCFRLVQQSLESDHSLFGLTVTAINYVDVHAALSAATVVPVILLTALPGSVNFALSIIYIDRSRVHTPLPGQQKNSRNLLSLEQ